MGAAGDGRIGNRDRACVRSLHGQCGGGGSRCSGNDVDGFLLCAVGGYLVGLVGSSNQPLSGLTLSSLILSALLLTGFGVRGAAGIGAVLGVAAVVATAVSVSGSLVQDFKAGQLLGGTPWKMQLVEIITVTLLAFFLMAPVILLHEANLDTGGIGGRALPAPQAGLMAQLAKGIVGGEMAWGLLGIGAAFGIALLCMGARSPMLIAVGMYLPFDTTSAIAARRADQMGVGVEHCVAIRGTEARDRRPGIVYRLWNDRRRSDHGHHSCGDISGRHSFFYSPIHGRGSVRVLTPPGADGYRLRRSGYRVRADRNTLAHPQRLS